jgi:hypothetical protein
VLVSIFVAMAAMGAVLTAAVLTAERTAGSEDAAAWVEAIATLCAFGAAVAAAILVWRTVRIELDREEQRLLAVRQEQRRSSPRGRTPATCSTR